MLTSLHVRSEQSVSVTGFYICIVVLLFLLIFMLGLVEEEEEKNAINLIKSNYFNII